MAKNTSQSEGRKGNVNAVTHGCYIDLSKRKLDGRTRLARLLSEIEAELVSAVGGDPSPQEILLIKRASVKAMRCAAAEKAILEGSDCKTLTDDYLRWTRELREDLKALGLQRRAKPVTDALTYIQEQSRG